MKNIITTSIFAVVFGFAFAADNDVFVDDLDLNNYGAGENYARYTYADKGVYVTHENDEREHVVRNLPAASGDFLETRTASYAEIEFIDGSLMQVADRTHVEFQAINEIFNNESLSVFKLYKGSLFLHVTDEWHHADRRVFRVDSEDGSVYIEAPGIYRVDRESGSTTLKVFRGFAELSGERFSEPVYAGEYTNIRNMGRPNSVRTFNSFYGDRFERWAYERRPLSETVSAKYVDPSLSVYSRDLDDHGTWRYESDLNVHVWVPYVSSGWRPYNDGYWTNRHSRMTWVSYDAFGYITHHYGRWGWNVGLGWYWIPGRRYSPAWVAWSTYDTYIGWCPLGYYNRPYYYGRNGYNTIIINNHYNRWRYVSSRRIIQRERIYPVNRVRISGKRHITTRSVYLSRESRRDATKLTRIVREPTLNQRLARERNYSRGTIVQRGSSGTISRTRIDGARAGTRTVVRHSPGITRTRGDAGYTTNSSRTNRDAYNSSRTTRGSVDRSSTNSSRYTPNAQSSRDRGTVSRDAGSNTRQSATRGSSSSRDRGTVTRGSSSNRSSSSATRSSSNRTQPSATRGSSSNRSQPSTSRSSTNRAKPSATRGTSTRKQQSKPSTSKSNTRKPRTSSSSNNNGVSMNNRGSYQPAPRSNRSYSTPSRSSSNRSSATSTRSSSNRSSATSSRSSSNRSSASSSRTSNRSSYSAPRSNSSSQRATRSSSSSSRTKAAPKQRTTRKATPKPRQSTPKRATTSRSSSKPKRNN